jgi:hypothetical protein
VIADDGGAQRQQPVDLVVTTDASWLQVQMEPVLHGLALR